MERANSIVRTTCFRAKHSQNPGQNLNAKVPDSVERHELLIYPL